VEEVVLGEAVVLVAAAALEVVLAAGKVGA
jgi:hypothetical protein